MSKQLYQPYRPCDVPRPIRFACCRAPFRWSLAQRAWIIHWYPDMRNQDVCDALNISQAELYRFVKETKLSKSKHFKAWNAEELKSVMSDKPYKVKHESPLNIREKFDDDNQKIADYYRDKHYQTGQDRCSAIALSFREYGCSIDECKHIAAVMYDAWCWGNPFNERKLTNIPLWNKNSNNQ